MLAPIDKMKNRGNDTIQIVITRKCNVFNCTNCTQLLPFRKDALEMSLECVEEALLSVQGWPGVVACFGGNPTSHSQFPEVCHLWQKHIPNQRQRGLWTNDLLKHGQIAKDTFWPHGRFNLNVHADSEAARKIEQFLPGIRIHGEHGRNHHSAMLLDYKDFGVSESDWAAKRETCDINRNWSGGIYQGPDGRPYAYFCEVAGSLSGVRGENNGILAEPGWWRWGMDRFVGQIHSCCDQGCGVPLRRTGHQDTDEIYDISPSWKWVEKQKVGRVSLVVHETPPQPTHETTDYIGLRLPKSK